MTGTKRARSPRKHQMGAEDDAVAMRIEALTPRATLFIVPALILCLGVAPTGHAGTISTDGITVLVDEDQQANLTTATNANVTSQSSVFFGLTDSTHEHQDDIDADGRTADDADLLGVPVWLTDEDPEAKCLDGSPGLLHFSRGSSTTRGWIIHHSGGGWCTSLPDCCRRAVTSLGSTSAYTSSSTIDMRNLPLGYLSRSNATNPYMAEYNIAILTYCDGASFSGNLEQPIRNVCKGLGQPESLYSRGFRILQAAFSYLVKQGLHSAQEVVVSGNSAGGKATYIHLDWWAQQIHSVAPMSKVYGLPDDGMFLDFDRDYSVFNDERTTWEGNVRGRYTQQIQWVFHMMNTTASLDQSCLAHYTPLMVPWKCMFGQHALPFIDTPVFALQTMYDSWQMHQILVHEGYEEPVREFAQLSFTATQRVNTLDWHGGWLTGCYKHCGLWAEIEIDGVNTPEAFEMFKSGTKRVWSQGMMSYPCESCCHRYENPRSEDFSLTHALNSLEQQQQQMSLPVVGSVSSNSNSALGIGLGVGGGVLFVLLVGYIVVLHAKVEKSKNAQEKFREGIKRVMSKRTLNALRHNAAAANDQASPTTMSA